MAASPFLVPFADRARPQVRLVCFPHAGGSAAAFAPWSRALPDSMEVIGVQLPGRDTRRFEAPATDVASLVSDLERALRPLLERPLVLFGHSLGALIAFECARALQLGRTGAPARLLVSGSRGPQRPRGEPISQLPDAAFIDAMARRYDGIPKLILDDAELLRYFLPVLRADLKLFEAYRYAPAAPLACPIDAFGGSEDARVPASELEAWSAETSAGFRWQLFPGGHFYLTSARDALLRSIASSVSAAAA